MASQCSGQPGPFLPDRHFLSSKKIIISGAGIGGLALAIALRKQWPQYTAAPFPELTVYERETQQNAIGREGYSQSIRSDAPGGIQALQKLGILDDLRRVAISAADASETGGFCIWDGTGAQLAKIRARPPEGLPIGGMRIKRSNLRAQLVRAAEVSGCTITWDTGIAGVARHEADGRLEVRLMDGRVDVCDLFVAADGASSKVRAQLRPDDGLVFAGIVMLMGLAKFGEDRPPKPVDCDWGTVITGKGPGLFVSPVDAHSALWSISYRSEEPRERLRQPVGEAQAEALMAEARGYADLFPSWFTTMVDATPLSEVGVTNARDKQPFAHTDDTFPDVVFIGDANHAVTPFAGNGANMALNDGWDLATFLCMSESVAEAVKRYDDMVVPRSTTVWEQSHQNINNVHAAGRTQGST